MMGGSTVTYRRKIIAHMGNNQNNEYRGIDFIVPGPGKISISWTEKRKKQKEEHTQTCDKNNTTQQQQA